MEIIDFILHVDKHLQDFVIQYDNLVYAILFLIIFVETGLIVMPFLPGDSLLFAAGMFAAQGSLNVTLLIPLLLIAAFCGDNTNYFVRRFAPFVAGVGSMSYRTFIVFSLSGAVLWVAGITLIGYFLGNIDIVKNN